MTINSFFHQIKILTGAFVLLVTLMVPYSSDANDNEYVPTTLITGANRGIGFEFAKQYLAKGWKVIATCRKPETADQLILLQKQFPSLLIIDRLDVTDHSQIDQLAEKYATTAIDVLLNNAGISGDTKNQIFGTMNYDIYNKVLAVNTIGPLKMAEAFYSHVKASEQKKIITVSSSEGSIATADKRGGGRLFFYRSSKSALNMVMVNLALQLKSRGVAVGMVNPGATDTDFMTGLPIPLRKTEVAVSDMIRNIDSITVENTGAYLNYNGKTVPW